MVEIAYWMYELTPKSALSAKANAMPRRGALLRINYEDRIGYADLHPWPELGDPTVTEQLENLKNKRLNEQISRTLHLAHRDAEARHTDSSLFEGLQIPASHWLCTDSKKLTNEKLNTILDQGFTHIKLKIGKCLEHEADTIRQLVNYPLTVRLDANEYLSHHEFRDLLTTIDPILHKIEFVEDPCPYNEETWTKLQNYVPLAADRQVLSAVNHPEAAAFLIIKPALMDVPQATNQRLIFTSYVDHPVGQMSAAYCAALHQNTEVCGLLTHYCYTPNAFSSTLSNTGPQLEPTTGTGIGFDHLLEALPWKNLTQL